MPTNRYFDIVERISFRPFGLGVEWPPINPVPIDPTQYTIISSSQIITVPEDDTPRWLFFTSGATLDTSVQARLYVPRQIEVISARVQVTTAPSSTLTGDLLKNGTSIFTTKPTVASGARFGSLRQPDTTKANFAKDDYMECQLTATGSAGGPAMWHVLYRRTG